MADADDLVLEISGIRPGHNPVLVNSDAAAMRLADFAATVLPPQPSFHTAKTLNTFTFAAGAGSGSVSYGT